MCDHEGAPTSAAWYCCLDFRFTAHAQYLHGTLVVELGNGLVEVMYCLLR